MAKEENGTTNEINDESRKTRNAIESELSREINEIHIQSSENQVNTGGIDRLENLVDEIPEPPKREENPFSLKHFLNRDQPVSQNNSQQNNYSSLSYQNSTGTRPKVPQNDISSNNISNNSGGLPNKMKRSPRFPSFDSQASLNEYKRDDNSSMTNLFHSRSNTSFTTSTGNSGIGCNNGEYSPNHEFQRSFSNYDIESPRTSPRCDRRKNGTRHGIGRNTEFSSALPDFVQDHLVVEQLYNAFGSPPATTSPLTLEGAEHGPDFDDIISRVRPEVLPSASCNDIPFDLTYNSNECGRRSRTLNSPIPLDLPSNHPPDIPHDLPMRRDGRRNPLSADLTLDLTGTSSDLSINDHQRNHRSFHVNNNRGGGMELLQSCDNKIQTLPDFLSDGPIHSSGRLADVAQDLPSHIDSPEDESLSTIMSRLRLENERLRMELDESRRSLSERTRRVNELERVIENERKNENHYTASLAHSMEQVEENLDRSNKRAAASQSLANKLKQQVKQLTAEMETLRRENEMLKEESTGAVGGSGTRTYHHKRPSRTQQLSQELMLAASNAENNLRQLLTGVDNLRIMAATIENLDRITDGTNPDYLSDECEPDEDDWMGPAL